MRFGKVCFILAIVVLGLAACAQSPDCFREDVFCAGLVTDTQGIDDHGINQDTWAGLQETKSNGTVDGAEYIESIDTRDYEKNITYFVEHGYDVIITTGAGLRDETLHSADLYPDSAFVGMNQPQEEVRPNLFPITFAEEQMGFVAGSLAVRISETQIVGAICETSGISSMWRYCEGFRAGVKFTNQLLGRNVKALVMYRENGSQESLFLDDTWGYDTAQELILSGADVIFATGGLTGQGALRAAAETHIHAIGSERDQAAVLGESGSSVVTSIFGDASFEVQNMMRLLKDGNADNAGSTQIKVLPFSPKFPESLPQEMDNLLLSLKNGEITTNVAPEKP